MSEKVPQEYEPSIIQRIVDRITQSIDRNKQTQDKQLYDTSVELKDSINSTEERLSGRLNSATGGEQPKTPTIVPPPENLRVFEFGTFGFAYVDPFTRWKYPFTIRNYEFFGDMNDGFDIHEEAYTQKGVHFGGNGESYLDTEDPLDVDSFILNKELVGFGREYTLENVTKGTSGTISSYGLARPKYLIRAPGVTWDNGDIWRIKNYPKNKMFNIGSLCIFSKRIGNFYVKARTVGKGYSYSSFTEQVSSEGTTSSSEIDAPTIVPPIHNCQAYDPSLENRYCTLEAAYNYRPRCPDHGVVPWTEIIGGSRETDHFAVFGVEVCNVELVYNEVEDDTLDVNYYFRRFQETVDTSGTPDETDLV